MKQKENTFHVNMESPQTIIADWKRIHQAKSTANLTLVDTPFAKGTFKHMQENGKMLAFISAIQYLEDCTFEFSNSHLASGWVRILISTQNCLLIAGDAINEYKTFFHNTSVLKFRGEKTYWKPDSKLESPLEIVAIFLSREWMDKIGLKLSNVNDNLQNTDGNTIFNIPIQPSLRNILDQTFSSAKKQPVCMLSDKVLLSHLWALAFSSLFHYSNSLKEPHTNALINTVEDVEKRLWAVRKKMMSDFSNTEHTLDYWARMAGMNRTSFQKNFKKLFNTSFYKFYQEARFNEALKLLKFESYTVTSAAAAIGYKNVGYFIKEFQKRFGMTPNECKNNGEDI